MQNEYIYIKLCGINIPHGKLILKNKCNKTVFSCYIKNTNIIKLPICNLKVYKLIIITDINDYIIPLIARKNKTYYININNNRSVKKRFITIRLMDKNYPNLRIKGGEMIIWQDIQFQ